MTVSDEHAVVPATPGPLASPWATIIATHDRRVLLLLLAMGLRVDEAKEIAQSTWLRLMEQEQRGALARMEFPGLALRQARFLALDALKARGRALPPAELLVDEPVDPEQTAIARESVRRVLSALDRCPPSAQRVFRAVYEEPSTPHAEVAVKVGLSVQRVRQILCEVRRTLREALEVGDG